MKFDDEICKGVSCPECSFNKGEDGCLLAKRLDEIEIISEPEIVRCKNCKHNQLPATSGNANCEIYYGMTDQDGFCHKAERRTDDQT